MAVAEQHRTELEQLAVPQPDPVPDRRIDRFGGDDVVDERQHPSLLAVDGVGVGLGREHDPVGRDGAVVGANRRPARTARTDRLDRGCLVDAPAPSFHLGGDAQRERCRLNGRGVRREDRAADRWAVEDRSGVGSIEPLPCVAEPEARQRLVVMPEALQLAVVHRGVDRTTAVEAAVDGVLGDERLGGVDGADHLARHRLDCPVAADLRNG